MRFFALSPLISHDRWFGEGLGIKVRDGLHFLVNSPGYLIFESMRKFRIYLERREDERSEMSSSVCSALLLVVVWHIR